MIDGVNAVPAEHYEAVALKGYRGVLTNSQSARMA